MATVKEIFNHAIATNDADDCLRSYWEIEAALCDAPFVDEILPPQDRQCEICGKYPIVFNSRRVDCDNQECLEVRFILGMSTRIDKMYNAGQSRDERVIAGKAALAIATEKFWRPDGQYTKHSLRNLPLEKRFHVARICADYALMRAEIRNIATLTKQLTEEIKNGTK